MRHPSVLKWDEHACDKEVQAVSVGCAAVCDWSTGKTTVTQMDRHGPPSVPRDLALSQLSSPALLFTMAAGLSPLGASAREHTGSIICSHLWRWVIQPCRSQWKINEYSTRKMDDYSIPQLLSTWSQLQPVIILQWIVAASIKTCQTGQKQK